MIKKMPKNILSALLALTAALGFFFWAFEDDDSSPFELTSNDEEAPTWYWYNAHFWSFSETGSIAQDATAIDVKHYNEEDVTYLSEPRVTSYLNEEDIWYTRAERGEMRDNNQVIELYTDVAIRKAGGSINMRTQKLVLDRDRDMAHTDLPVTITGEGNRTEGVGMQAWLKREKVELLSRVRSTYASQAQ